MSAAVSQQTTQGKEKGDTARTRKLIKGVKKMCRNVPINNIKAGRSYGQNLKV
jgi:hypothetical protein